MTALQDYKPFLYSKLTEAHLFSEVGRIIAAELEPAELVRKVLGALSKAIRFEDASVYLVRKDLTGLVPLCLLGDSLPRTEPESIYFDNGAPGHIAATGEPLFLIDSSKHETFLHYPDEPARPGSYMGLPLKNDTRIVGVMGFSHSKPGAFTVDHFDLIRILADTISAGLAKADLYQKAIESSRTDELTGLLNYRVLLEKLDEETGRQVRTGRDFSFLMIDIDNFKRVNDRYGHLEGSRVLAQLGALLRDTFRTGSTDACFRYGGEEFSIVLAETGFDKALEVAERVRRTIEEYPFTLKALHPDEPLTVSIGVTTKQQGDNKSTERLVEESDIALYLSKTTGKNRITGFREGLTMPRAALDARIRQH